jgi:hypothetical protein
VYMITKLKKKRPSSNKGLQSHKQYLYYTASNVRITDELGRIWKEECRDLIKVLSRKDSMCPGRDLNLAPPEQKSDALPIY